jgi:hypothetical protein
MQSYCTLDGFSQRTTALDNCQARFLVFKEATQDQSQLSNHWFVNLVVSSISLVPFITAHSVPSEITIIPGQCPNYL